MAGWGLCTSPVGTNLVASPKLETASFFFPTAAAAAGWMAGQPAGWPRWMDGWAKQIEAADNFVSHLPHWCSISTRFILPHPISWFTFKLAGYLPLSACFNQCKQRLAGCSIWHLVPLWRHPSDLSLNPEKGQAMSQRKTQRGPSYRGVSQQLEASRWERPTTRKRIGFV